MDEDDMEKELNQPPVQKKRHRDDHDQDPLTDAKKDFKKKKKKDSDEPSSKKTTYQPTSSKKGTTPSKPLKSDKSVQADETIEELDQEEAIDDEEPAVDEMVNTEEHPQDDDGLSQDRSSIELEYHLEQRYLAFSKQLDWPNLEGDRCPYDLSKPVPLQDMSLRLWSSTKVFYDKDVALGISHCGPKRQLFYRSRNVAKSWHDVFSHLPILGVV
ncbi:hypothetical protein Tco_0959938, partial [Tanacetum coccineum]